MTQQPEQTIRTAREYPLSLGCLAKFVITLGIHTLWRLVKQLTVTYRRVIWRTGLIAKNERSIPLSRVQDVTVKCGIIGRLLRYGTIGVEPAGGAGTEILANDINNPGAIKDDILSQLP